MINERNFISPEVTEEDKDLFFGPLDGEEFTEIQDFWIMAHIMHESRVFRSVSDARRNGWNKPIPDGFSFFETGKRANRRKIFILRTP